MKTRKIASIALIISAIGLAIIFTTQIGNWAYLGLISALVLTIHLSFISDERVQPYTTIFDWITGNFIEPDEMDTHGAKRRLNVLQYKAEEGPFKIRFLFKRRHSSDEINEAKEKLRNQLPDDSNKSTS